MCCANARSPCQMVRVAVTAACGAIGHGVASFRLASLIIQLASRGEQPSLQLQRGFLAALLMFCGVLPTIFDFILLCGVGDSTP
jgi:hypothetical protein